MHNIKKDILNKSINIEHKYRARATTLYLPNGRFVPQQAEGPHPKGV